jgi:hypothetical protein
MNSRWFIRHLVGERLDRRRDFHAERLCSCDIDDQIELCRELHRHVGVNAVGPIRQIVRSADKAQRRYLVIVPGTIGKLGAPVQVQAE